MDFSRNENEDQKQQLLRVALQSEIIKVLKDAKLEVTDCKVKTIFNAGQSFKTIDFAVTPYPRIQANDFVMVKIAAVCAEQMKKLGYEGQRVVASMNASRDVNWFFGKRTSEAKISTSFVV